jgi:hypothetical protein
MTSDTPAQPTRDEAIALLRKGLDHGLQMAAAQYVMPICWVTAEKGKPLILGNGSAFMLDAGADPFLVRRWTSEPSKPCHLISPPLMEPWCD